MYANNILIYFLGGAMVIKNFHSLLEKAKSKTKTNNKTKTESTISRVAVAGGDDIHTLEAIYKAYQNNIVEPILVGNKEKIIISIEKIGAKANDFEIVDCNDESVGINVVKLVNDGKADFIMKGNIQTKDLLKPIVNKETGLNTGRVMSHVALFEVPTYHKLMCITDGGMLVYPDLEEKKAIVENAVDTFNRMGYERPNVAFLCAVEKVNPKIEETVHAKAIKDMNLPNCVFEGPISYDLAMSKESAQIKGYESPVCEDVDIFVVPNITTGNVLAKSLIYSAKAQMAGIIVGAKVPIILTSRGASANEKYLSIAFASVYSSK